MKDYTVKEIADRLKVSKTTVKKYIKANKINYSFKERNKEFYNYENTKRIIKLIDNTYDLSEFESENSPENIENSPAESENSQTKLANAPAESENSQDKVENSPAKQDITEIMLEMLQKEIEKKDKEIYDLRDRLDKAYDRIADLANKAQYITAADKTAQIMDKQQPQEEIKEPAAAEIENNTEIQQKEVKKGFFKRLIEGIRQ